MTEATYVFIHGGQHTGACWDLTISALKASNAQAKALAVNLPGRAGEPGDLITLTIQQCVDSVIRQINASATGRVILVGHSMAGITLPGVAIGLGAERVARMVFLSCCIPPEGKTVIDTLRWPIKPLVAMSRSRSITKKLSPRAAAFMFGNGMTPAQKEKMFTCLCDESGVVGRQAVSRIGLPAVPKTWILLKRDRALSVGTQRQFIANLGGVDELVEMDTCHNAMISEPVALARILLASGASTESAQV